MVALETTFRVTNVGDPASWVADGPVADDVAVRVRGAVLEVEMPVRAQPVHLHGRPA